MKTTYFKYRWFVALLLSVVMMAGSFGGYAAEASSTFKASAKSILSDVPADDYQIQPEDLLTQMKSGNKPFIVDIRTAQEFKKNHLKGSYNMPWGVSMGDQLCSLPKDQTLYVLSWDGQMAGQCAILLNISGFKAKYVNSGLIYVQDQEGYEAQMEKGMTLLPRSKTPVAPETISFVKSYIKSAMGGKDTRFMNNLVSERNLRAMMKKDPNSVVIIDVRSSTDFLLGHFDGSISVPFGSNMDPMVKNLPQNKKIVVVCYVAQNSSVVTAALRTMGYDAVSLNGGSVGLTNGF